MDVGDCCPCEACALRRSGALRPSADVHVTPQFGKPHECWRACWCEPKALPDTLDRTKYDGTVWVHEVPN